MNDKDNNDPNSFNSPHPGVTSTPSPQTNYHNNAKKHYKSKAAKAKSADHHRTVMNAKVGQPYIQKQIDKIKNMYCIPDDFIPISHLADPSVPQSPPLQVPITPDFGPELVESVITQAHVSCKVPAGQYGLQEDIKNEQLVLALQVENKLYHAMKSGPFPVFDGGPLSVMIEARSSVVEKRLRSTLSPIATYLDQIGKFELDGQLFVPTIEPESSVLYESFSNTGYPKSRAAKEVDVCIDPFSYEINMLDYSGRKAWIKTTDPPRGEKEGWLRDGVIDKSFSDNPVEWCKEHRFDWHECAFEFISPSKVLPSLDEIISRHDDYITRVSRRLGRKVVDVDLKSGKGTEAQLGVQGDSVPGGRVCFSPRKITSGSLIMSSLYGLCCRTRMSNGGRNHPMVDPRVAAVEVIVYAYRDAQLLASHLLTQYNDRPPDKR